MRCQPPPGSQFPIGTTTVVCTAEDKSGNKTSCHFTVTVLGAKAAIQRVGQEVELLKKLTTYSKDEQRLSRAAADLDDALAPSLWLDETHLQRKKGHSAFDELQKAAKDLDELTGDRRSQVSSAAVEILMERMAQVARLLAVVALEEDAAADPKKLSHDSRELDRGDDEAARAEYDKAIEHYGKAWQHAAHRVKMKARASGGHLRVEFPADPGETYAIEASTDLIHWVTLGIRTAGPDGTVPEEDPASTKHKSRFYRARWVP